MSLSWFLATASLVVVVTLVGTLLTARAIRRRVPRPPGDGAIDPRDALGLSRRSLYLNVVASQGTLLAVLTLAVVWFEIELAVLGVDPSIGPAHAVVLGLVIGLVLAGTNRIIEAPLGALGIRGDDRLRRLLAPTTRGEWVLAVGLVFPVVAVFEELLFRGILIGAAGAGLELTPWVLVVPSSLVFAMGHALQGRAGLLVAGALGVALGATFVVTESLLIVVLAHYLVNVVELTSVQA